MTSMSKQCTGCGVRKPLIEFNKRKKASDGLRQTCKACDKVVRDNWEAIHRPKKGLGRAPEPEIEALPMGSEGDTVETEPEAVAPGPLAQFPGPSDPSDKVIGRIGTRIREVSADPTEEAERAAAKEYAALLNEKLPIRRRASLLVAIAKQAKGPTAALALQALRDINIATGVVSKQGTQVDLGPLFVLPEGTSMAMKGR